MTLWERWQKEYPDLEFTKDVQYSLKKGHEFQGGFAEGLIKDDMAKAFMNADIWNLPRLEKLVGITKQQFGEKHWDWPKI